MTCIPVLDHEHKNLFLVVNGCNDILEKYACTYSFDFVSRMKFPSLMKYDLSSLTKLKY